MKVIGVTGSIASGKSTVAQIIAKKKYPLFSADKIVLGLYKSSSFISLLTKKFKLVKKKKIRDQIKLLVKKNKKKTYIIRIYYSPTC